MAAKFRKFDETESEKCEFVIRDGNCEKCPHTVEQCAKLDAFKPICYKEPEDDEDVKDQI